MGSTVITWNSNTLTLPRKPESWTPVVINVTNNVMTDEGIVSSLHRKRMIGFKFTLNILTLQQEVDFNNFWYWASKGNEFAIAYDDGQDSNTTLDNTVTWAVVPLTATTGMTAGDRLILISADRSYMEEIVISSVSAGVSVTATGNLNHTFVAGDTCRHYDYLPYAKLKDPNKAPVKVGGEGKSNERNVTFIVMESVQE